MGVLRPYGPGPYGLLAPWAVMGWALVGLLGWVFIGALGSYGPLWVPKAFVGLALMGALGSYGPGCYMRPPWALVGRALVDPLALCEPGPCCPPGPGP